MKAQELLENILQSSREFMTKGIEVAEQKLGLPDDPSDKETMLKGAGKGAFAAGVLALMLGTGAGRRLTGSALKLGSLAAIGGIAYKAFKNMQGQDVKEVGTPINELKGPELESRSMMLLRAMIASAKADGHIDERERTKIDDLIKDLGIETSAASFLKEELEKPLDAKAIAAHADSPEAAAEIYLASRLVIDMNDENERKYLEELSVHLKLTPELITQLEEHAAKAD